MFDLSGRVALVTGAGQGVGAEVARVLASAGARVAVNDLAADRAAAVAAEIGEGRAVPAVADVTDRAAVTAMVADVERELGPVDVLVNNAGIPPGGMGMGRFVEEDPAAWERQVSLNVYGPMNCTHALLAGMVGRGWGRVVTVGSDSARVGDPGIAAYAAAKASGAALMRSLAAEVGRYGVTCNTLALGTIATPQMPVEVRERLAKRYAVRRLGTPADVAAAVLWMVSDEAAWLTGQTVPLNGGYAAS